MSNYACDSRIDIDYFSYHIHIWHNIEHLEKFLREEETPEDVIIEVIDFANSKKACHYIITNPEGFEFDFIYCKDKFDLPSMVHEFVHAIDAILHTRGVPITKENDEVRAYGVDLCLRQYLEQNPEIINKPKSRQKSKTEESNEKN